MVDYYTKTSVANSSYYSFNESELLNCCSSQYIALSFPDAKWFWLVYQSLSCAVFPIFMIIKSKFFIGNYFSMSNWFKDFLMIIDSDAQYKVFYFVCLLHHVSQLLLRKCCFSYFWLYFLKRIWFWMSSWYHNDLLLYRWG